MRIEDIINDVCSSAINASRNVIADHENETVFKEYMAGLRSMVGALVEAKVDDEVIIHLIQKYYGLNYEDANYALYFEKTILSRCRALEAYLVNEEGFLPDEAVDRIDKLNTVQQLKNKPELRKCSSKELYKYLTGQ